MNTENTLLQTREEEGVTYERTLVASEFIDWLIQEGEMPTREEAERLGRRLLEHAIIQHGERMDEIYICKIYSCSTHLKAAFTQAVAGGEVASGRPSTSGCLETFVYDIHRCCSI